MPAVASFLCSLGGLIYALKFGADPEFMVPLSIKAIALVVTLGALGGILTAGVATVALSMAEAAIQATPQISAYEQALAYVVLVVALLLQFVMAPRIIRWVWARRTDRVSA